MVLKFKKKKKLVKWNKSYLFLLPDKIYSRFFGETKGSIGSAYPDVLSLYIFFHTKDTFLVSLAHKLPETYPIVIGDFPSIKETLAAAEKWAFHVLFGLGTDYLYEEARKEEETNV